MPCRDPFSHVRRTKILNLFDACVNVTVRNDQVAAVVPSTCHGNWLLFCTDKREEVCRHRDFSPWVTLAVGEEEAVRTGGEPLVEQVGAHHIRWTGPRKLLGEVVATLALVKLRCDQPGGQRRPSERCSSEDVADRGTRLPNPGSNP